MQPGLLSIEDAFTACHIFRIPVYQRFYSWETGHLKQFMKDIMDFIKHGPVKDKGKSYFIGTLLLHKGDEEGRKKIFDIVDGQQRVTTIIILMHELISLMKNDKNSFLEEEETFIKRGGSYKLRYENDEDTKFLHRYILEDNAHSGIKNRGQENLWKAKKYFSKILAELDKSRDCSILDIFNTLCNSRILAYPTSSLYEATQVFLLQNDRGKSLTDLEKLKSFLIDRLLFMDKDPNEKIRKLNSDFSEIYKLVQNYGISEDNPFRYYFQSFIIRSIQEFNHNARERTQEIVLEKEDIPTFISNLSRELCETYQLCCYIFTSIGRSQKKDNKLDDAQIALIEDIDILGTMYFSPIIFYFYRKLYFKDIKQEEFSKLLEVVRQCILSFRLTGKRSNTGRNGAYSNFLNYRYTRIDTKTAIQRISDIKWFYNIPSLIKTELDSIGYEYKRDVCKYILFKYENYLAQEKYSSDYDLTKHDFYGKNSESIEHIFPQNDSKLDYDYDDDFRKNYLHSIGNLSIDSLSANIRKSNFRLKNDDSFKNKISYFKKSPLLCHQEIVESLSKLTDNLESAKDFIKKRGEKIKDTVRKQFPHFKW